MFCLLLNMYQLDGSKQLSEHEFCFYCSYVEITMELNTDIYAYIKLTISCLINVL